MVMEPLGFLARIPAFIGRYVFLIRDRKRQIHAGAAAVATELDFNADAAALYEAGGRDIASTRNEFAFSAWDEQQTTIHALHKAKDKTLWHEVAAAYADLRRTHARGAEPPSRQGLSELAQRLREARY